MWSVTRFGLLSLVCFCLAVHGKVFEKCEVSETFLKLGAPPSQLADWVCLVAHQGQFDSSLRQGPAADGSQDWGMFQISDNYWCDPTPPAGTDADFDRSIFGVPVSSTAEQENKLRPNLCNISCYKLIDDDLTDDFQCAQAIYNAHGYHAWFAWRQYCLNKDVTEYIRGCQDCQCTCSATKTSKIVDALGQPNTNL